MSQLVPKSLKKLILNGGDHDINFGKFISQADFQQDVFERFNNKDSQYVLKRTLYSFMKFNSINADKKNFLIGKMREVARVALIPFVGYSDSVNEKATFEKPSMGRVSTSIARMKNIISEYFEIGNVNVIYDFNKITSGENRNLKIFIDKYYKSYDQIEKDPLDFTKRNGNIKFVNPNGVMLTIVIPVSFLEDLASKYLNKVSTHVNSTFVPTQYDLLMDNDGTAGSRTYLSMDKFTDAFLTVFYQTFMISLYRERYRENLYSQMYVIFNIFHKENGFETGNLRIPQKELMERLVNKWKPILEKFEFYEKSRFSITVLSPPLSRIYDEVFLNNPISNPIDIYNTIFELPSYECNLLATKLGFKYVIEGIEYVRYSSSLYEINKDMGERYANTVVSTILMKRLVPIIILSEFIFGRGSKASVAKEILDKISFQQSRAYSRINDYVYSTNLREILESIKRDINQSKLMVNTLVNETILTDLLFDYDMTENDSLEKHFGIENDEDIEE